MTSPRPASLPIRAVPAVPSNGAHPSVPQPSQGAGGSNGSTPAAVRAARVLIVAEHDLRDRERDRETASRLREGGHQVATAVSGEQALDLLGRESFDVVITDVVLAGMSGLELCRRLRERSDLPVIFLTAVGGLSERLLAFDYGADDYVVWPVAPSELDRRIRAVLRRQTSAAGGGELPGPGGLRVDVRAHAVHVGVTPVHLTPKEFAVLRLLLERRGEVLSSDTISQEIWGHETFGSRNFVEAHVSRLRRKLLAAGGSDAVETVRGVGYVVRDA